MKGTELIQTLQDLIKVYGDIDVVCQGDHQMLYKVGGVEKTYVEDIEEYMMEEKHGDDVEDFIADGGRPTIVLAIFG
jgi:hypothetical protein